MSGKIAGVIGWPVAHSLSPVIHRYWLAEHGIRGDYVALPVAPENFSRCVRALPLMGFAGVNVTVPHKEAAAVVAETLDHDAKTTGAVNLLIFAKGAITGANTDVWGFGESLRQSFSVERLKTGPAVVLGAGGAARGIILALHKAGFSDVRIVNRTRQRAEAVAASFAAEFRCRVVDWGDWENAFGGALLLVNTTSLGMKGNPPLELPLGVLPGRAAVADIVYNPVRTALLRAAEKAGHPVMDGLGMLMHQAVPAFATWFGIQPVVTAELRGQLLKALPFA